MSRYFNLARVISLALLFLVGTYLYAQRSLVRTYTVGDGLVMNRVRGFFQDKDEFIWMYTWDGLSRYEGYRFRNYISGRDLQHSFVNDIFELPDGTLYLPLNDGNMAIIRNQEVENVFYAGNVINDFTLDENGRVYVATDKNGIMLFENDSLKSLAANASGTSVIQVIYHNKHFFFIGTYPGTSGVMDMEMNLVASWWGSPARYTALYKDFRDRMFVCTIEGLKEVDLTSPASILKELPEIPTDAPWKNWNVSSVIVTPEQDFWIGTDKGLIHLRPDKTWKVLTIQDGLLSNQVSTVFLDRSNTLWIGTDAGVASIHLQNRIEDNRQLPGVYASFVLPGVDGSALVISGFSILNQLNRQLQIVHSEKVKGSDGISALGLFPAQESILLFKQNAIEELEPKQFPSPRPGTYSPGLLYAKVNDKFWITSIFGFVCGSKGRTLKTVQFSGVFATCIAEKNAQLLVGTWESGIFVAEPDTTASSCRLNIIQNLSEWTGDLRIRSLMTSENGDIWAGTRFNGLLRLRCDDEYAHCATQSYSISEGLVSNWITAIAEDRYGNIWVGSASGIDKLIPKDDGYFVFPFSRVNGYYANIRHLAMHPDGSLWVGHNEGVARITDGNIDTIGPPATFITEVTLGGNDHPAFQSSSVNLRYDQNSAHFAFAAPDYINPSQLLFTYRLLGSKDTSWSQPVRIHEIFYGNLTPGNFTFEVAAFGWNGERSLPVSYAFKIRKPFWKQAWFVLLGMIGFVAAAFALYRFRIAQMHRVQTVRDRIAADLHDEIASTLTHINILSEIGKQQHPIASNSSNIFERIGSEVQSSSEALDDIIWSVKTKKDAIGDIIARMRQYATEIFEPAGIEFKLDENLHGIQSLEMEFKRDLYLVYKELLRNVLRHADATKVNIRIITGTNTISIEVQDNGKGFDVDSPTQRNGLSNIKSRVQKWKGSALWNSSPRKGTKVIVEMKPV
jgi:ligand-binding sensor domain-containing protein/two-component sensor histidine kinase